MANEFLKNLGTNLQELSGGPLVPANLDPANQGVGNYTQYGFQSGERGVQPLRYTGIGSQSLVNLNKTTYTAALNAASDQETTQLKKLYKKLTA